MHSELKSTSSMLFLHNFQLILLLRKYDYVVSTQSLLVNTKEYITMFSHPGFAMKFACQKKLIMYVLEKRPKV